MVIRILTCKNGIKKERGAATFVLLVEKYKIDLSLRLDESITSGSIIHIKLS